MLRTLIVTLVFIVIRPLHIDGYRADAFPVQSERAQLFSQYAGSYRLQPDHLVYIGTLGGFTDFSSGAFRLLSPVSEGTFTFGPSREVFTPVVGKITFIRDNRGRVTGFNLQEENAPPKIAHKIDLFKEEEVSFRNGEVMLAGTLLLPLTPGPHPAMVCIHAGQDQTRRSFGPPPYFFAANGFAVLIYDKRGNGGSTGNWRQAGFDDLAGDALAGVELLKKRADINPKQIGLWGISQGPWPAWFAASHSKDVAFVISVSGPSVTPARQALFVMETTLRDAGFTKDAIDEALAFQRFTDEVARGKKNREELEETVQTIQNKKWFSYVQPPSKGHWFWQWWPRIMDYDPVPLIEKVNVPVLAIYGGVDKLVWTDESVPILKKALTNAGNKHNTVKVFPKGNHDLYEAEPETSKQYARLKGYVPGYFDTMITWLKTLERK